MAKCDYIKPIAEQCAHSILVEIFPSLVLNYNNRKIIFQVHDIVFAWGQKYTYGPPCAEAEIWLALAAWVARLKDLQRYLKRLSLRSPPEHKALNTYYSERTLLQMCPRILDCPKDKGLFPSILAGIEQYERVYHKYPEDPAVARGMIAEALGAVCSKWATRLANIQKMGESAFKAEQANGGKA